MNDIFKTHYSKVFASIQKMTNDEHLTSDIVQDTFETAIQKINQLQCKDAAIGWLLQIAKNKLMDYYRTKEKQINVVADYNSEEKVIVEENKNEAVANYLEYKLTELPLLYQDAILKIEINGQKQTEVARQEIVSVSAIKSRIQRARKELKDNLFEDCNINADKYGNIIHCKSKIPNCTC
jgi:RNA polymerase sigma-70 factor, ECF subfamily